MLCITLHKEITAMQNYLIKNAQIINENKIFWADVLIKNQRIEKITP